MNKFIKKLNHDLGVFVCWITRKHREPHYEVTIHPWKVEMCTRCGHIFRKEKIGRTLREFLIDEWSSSGNQVW